ncbi:MAG: phosphoglucomutase/phosphomannomutase family protein [Candidatus Omnitrophica bacterium]|nr:phosphoglucomutase/phosphomannomutase family protein [Candidatus Omnitrophota bacterium]
MTIAFGTEGWRAIMAEEFTTDNVRIVTRAIAAHLLAHAPPAARSRGLTVAVGHDTRFLSDYFARAVCEVLAGHRIRSLLTDRAVPTCAVSRYVVANRLPAGVMVTASHNPAIYNGLKIKEAFGGSASQETVASVERRLSTSPVERMAFDEAVKAGLIAYRNPMPTYLSGMASFLDLPAIRRAGLRVIVDSMHGAGGRVIEELLRGGRCRVETLHAEPDPRFGGRSPEPIASNLLELRQAIRRSRADIGIANDGDADRIGVMGPRGVWLNPGQVLCLLLQHLIETRNASGTVVKTVSNTMMINRLAEALGLPVVEVPVGFKHIAKLMLEGDVLIGGEESGGIGVNGYLPERDGIFNGLLLLEAMAMRRRSLTTMLHQLERRYGRWSYGRRDLHLTMAQVDALFARLHASPPHELAGIPVVTVNTLDGVKLIGRDESWLLFRRSGTEPIVRIYAETPQQRRLARLLSVGVKVALKAPRRT